MALSSIAVAGEAGPRKVGSMMTLSASSCQEAWESWPMNRPLPAGSKATPPPSALELAWRQTESPIRSWVPLSWTPISTGPSLVGWLSR